MKAKQVFAHENFGLLLVITTLVIQATQSASVFAKLSSFEGWHRDLHSIGMASVISGAILYFTITKGSNTWYIKQFNFTIHLPQFFAWFEAYVNICYYILHIIDTEQSFMQLFMDVPISTMLPITLYFYSENLKEKEIPILDIETQNSIVISNLLKDIDKLKGVIGKEVDLKIIKRDEANTKYKVVIGEPLEINGKV